MSMSYELSHGRVRHHHRSGKLDKPEACHDARRAAALNMMQAPPKATVDLLLTSGSVLALFRLATMDGEWMPATQNGKNPGMLSKAISRADVLALIERRWVEESKRGFRITDEGNVLARELVTFVRGQNKKGGES